MANRTPGTMPAPTADAVIGALLRRIGELEARLEALEARDGRTLPGDFRFQASDDGASVEVRRVSTGNAAPIVGPL